MSPKFTRLSPLNSEISDTLKKNLELFAKAVDRLQPIGRIASLSEVHGPAQSGETPVERAVWQAEIFYPPRLALALAKSNVLAVEWVNGCFQYRYF